MWDPFCEREGAIQRGENATVTASENGFAVGYNHPVWSTVVPKDYLDLKELMGMEIWNTGSPDTLPEDGAAFREMIYSGNKLFAVASNDFHRLNDKYDALQGLYSSLPKN